MTTKKPILGYWDIRGLGQPIRTLLHYLCVDYEEKLYTKGTDFRGESWFREKFNLGLELPNIPYWIDDEVKLTETKAILKYICRVHGPHLIPSSPQSQAMAEMLEGYIQDLHLPLVRLLYFSKTKPPPADETALDVSLAQRFQQLENFLGKRKWTAGDELSYVDFYVYEILYHFQKFKDGFLKPYPALSAYVKMFEAIPQVADYLKACANMTCYSEDASIFF